MSLRTCRHSHSTEAIEGYRVVQTIADGQHLQVPRLLADDYSPTEYCGALQHAQQYRQPRRQGVPTAHSWAVVDTLYSCGCWSTDRYTDDDMARENSR